MKNDLIPATKEVREALTSYIFSECVGKISHYSEFRERYTRVDREYSRKEKRKPDDVVVPVILSQVKTAKATFTNIFASRTPLFQVVGNKEYLNEARVLTNLFERDANFYSWRAQLGLAFGDGLRYNIFATEVSWEHTKRFTFDATQKRKLIATVYSGNRIKRINPYNLFFDPRVPIGEHHLNAEFCGYVELYTRPQFDKFWQEHKEQLYTDDKNSIFAQPTTYYYATAQESQPNVTNWGEFFDGKNGVRRSHGIEVATFYLRCIPNDFKIRVPDDTRPQVLCLMFANGRLIHLSQYISIYNYFPILLGQPIDDGLLTETDSLAESLIDVQRLSTIMWNAELNATRRVVADRGIYDPSRIAKEHIETDNPAAKIPLRRSSYQMRPQDAYYPIPYNDPALGLRLAQARELFDFGYVISGQNPVSQGQFVRGNKTNAQFQESMAASQSRIFDILVLLEDQFFRPLKYTLLENVFANVAPQEIFDRETEQKLTVDPVALKNLGYDLEISDGIFEAQRIVGLDGFINLFTMLSSFPDFRLEYDMPGMLAYIAEISGAKHAKDFKLSPEQVQQKLMQIMAINAAQSAGKTLGEQTNAAPV